MLPYSGRFLLRKEGRPCAYYLISVPILDTIIVQMRGLYRTKVLILRCGIVNFTGSLVTRSAAVVTRIKTRVINLFFIAQSYL